MRKQSIFVAMLLFVLTAAAPAFAQRITGTIQGTVTDAQGAVVPGAKVTVTNEATGFRREMTTTSAGLYSVAELPVGTYRVEVEREGFKTEARSGIELNVADARAVDVQLQTGDITEVVTVEVPAVAVRTIGGDISGLVTGEQARELPLNGRNFMQLTLLQPGVNGVETLNTVDKGLAGGSDISVSGGSTTSNVWMVDGANNNDVGSNRTILVYPSVDAIEEFKIQRNNYGAEFGQAGGAQVNLVTRGGTNEFHGSVYYFGRRDQWNSTDFFLKQAGQEKAPLSWHDFGGTLGGPIIKDKLHFFYSQEWNRDRRNNVRVAQTPTELERAGNFSGSPSCTEAAPIDPLTGLPFPGGIIPPDRISPGGQALLRLMSLPNTSPTGGSCNNWVSAVPTPVDWRQESARVDWTINSGTRVMLRYTQDSWEGDRNQWGDDPFPSVRSLWNQPGKSLVAQLNTNIGSRMLNTLTFSYSANKIEVTRATEDEALVNEVIAGIPTLFPADIKQQGGEGLPHASWGSIGNYAGGNTWNQAPWLNNQDLYVLRDDYSAVFGKHFLKIGGLVSFNKKNEEPNNTSQESVAVTGAVGFIGPDGVFRQTTTGNVLANWLLEGIVWNTSEVRSNTPVNLRWNDYEFYVNDTFRANSQLTLDLGVRLSHFTMPFEADDRMATFNPQAADPALGNSPCNGLLFPPGTNPCPDLGLAGGGDAVNRSLIPTKSVLVAPRFGFAWDVFGTGKTALRGGFGAFFARERVSPGLFMGLNPPFSGTATVQRTLASPQPIGGAANVSVGAPSVGWEQRAANQHNWQWNIAVQQEVYRNTVVEVAYVGNKGVDLLGQTNLNEIPPALRLQFARTNDASLRPLFGIAGLGNGNMPLWTHNRNSIYHGLQVAASSRFGNGSQAQIAYTWAKVTANTGIGNADGGGISSRNAFTDSTQPELDRARGAIDRRHVFAANLLLGLPDLDDKSGFVKGVFGNWDFSTIVQAATGYPITVLLGGGTGLPGSVAGTGYTGNERPDLVAGQPCRASGGSETQWLNPAAFTLNGRRIGTNGTAGRHICDGPSFFRVDASLSKSFKLGRRVELQLRAEMFNVFNRTNFLISTDGNPEMTWNPQNVTFDTGNPATATTITGSQAAGGFGQLNQAAIPREMQLGIRLSF